MRKRMNLDSSRLRGQSLEPVKREAVGRLGSAQARKSLYETRKGSLFQVEQASLRG